MIQRLTERRLGWRLSVGLLLVVVGCVFVVLDYAAGLRASRAQEALRAAGHAMDIADVIPPAPVGGQNAATAYAGAAALLERIGEGGAGPALLKLLDASEAGSASPTALDGAARLLASDDADLIAALLQKGAAIGECRFAVDYRSASAGDFAYLDDVRQLVAFALLRSAGFLHAGHEDAAEASLVSAYGLLRAIEGEPFLGAQLLRADIAQRVLRAIQRSYPALEDPSATFRNETLDLLKRLDRRDALALALDGERLMFHQDLVLNDPRRRRLFRGPWVKGDAASYFEAMAVLGRVAYFPGHAIPSRPSVLALEPVPSRHRWTHALIPTFDGLFQQHQVVAAQSRVSLLGVMALELAAAKGGYAESLAELALTEVSALELRDPYTADTLGYEMVDGAPLVYCTRRDPKDLNAVHGWHLPVHVHVEEPE